MPIPEGTVLFGCRGAEGDGVQSRPLAQIPHQIPYLDQDLPNGPHLPVELGRRAASPGHLELDEQIGEVAAHRVVKRT